jgi:hypothetical protein
LFVLGRERMSDFNGTIETTIRVSIKLLEFDDNEQYIKFRMDDKTYRLVKTMLDTGAPVYFGMKKENVKQEVN